MSFRMKDYYFFYGGSTKRCMACGSDVLFGEVISADHGFTSEWKLSCTKCKEEVGYWAYGHWNPYYEDILKEKIDFTQFLQRRQGR